MTHDQAIWNTARAAVENFDHTELLDAIELYDSLALILPSKRARIHCERVAFALKEVRALQDQLRTDIKRKKHRNE